MERRAGRVTARWSAMRYTMTMVALSCALALLVSSVAVAAPGGTPGPPGGEPPGQAAKAGPGTAVEGDEPGDLDGEGPKEPGWGKLRAAERRAEREAALDSEGEKPTGLENARLRIEANIAKAELKVAEGKKKQVPAGLLAVSAKFATWLEGEGAPVGEEADEPAGEDADEE
jgi:hypothetical protein